MGKFDFYLILSPLIASIGWGLFAVRSLRTRVDAMLTEQQIRTMVDDKQSAIRADIDHLTKTMDMILAELVNIRKNMIKNG